MISEFSPLGLVAALGVATVTAKFLARFFDEPKATARFSAVDGLRGYLAFFVFIHHASIWYGHTHAGVWKLPPAHLYAHLGQSSVVLFFMITAFLFYTKILGSEAGKIQWTRIASSRLLRIFPLYIFAIGLMVLTVFLISNWELRDPPLLVIRNIAQWLSLTLLGAPKLNQFEHTGLITAGVTWSLPYEWMFYCCLPLLAVFAGKKPGKAAMLFGLFSALFILKWRPDAIRCLSFLGGIAAAYAVRTPVLSDLSRTPIGSALATMSVLAAVILFPSGYNVVSIALFGMFFCIVACGNDLFGTLSSRTAKIMGEMAYSIYLLHGILLFYLFTFAVGKESASTLSPMEHWVVVIGSTPILLIACTITFKRIEAPFMSYTGKLSATIAKTLEGRLSFPGGYRQ